MVILNREYIEKAYEYQDLQEIGKLEFYNHNITSIEPQTFKQLTGLVKIVLNDNSIEDIDARLFEGLSNLLFLSLNNNKLKQIDTNTLKDLTKLQWLFLYNNEIEEIDSRLFESLSNLEELFLQNNRLKRIDVNTFKGLTKLKILRLDSNNLKQIDPNTFKDLTSLQTLRLDNNQIEGIDMRLFESLSNLEYLWLNNNKLADIETRRCFDSLKSIIVVQLYENENLKARSFVKPSADFWHYEKEKVTKYGFLSDWNDFLQQFPLLYPIGDPYIGKKLINKYEVKKKIGQGSYGSVYLIIDSEINDKKVVKILESKFDRSDNEFKRFTEINHDNIVRFFDHFHDDEKTFLITDYCENGDLANKIKSVKTSKDEFEESQILKWMCQSTNALNYLHSLPEPIIHRDIKPSNLLLTKLNEVKLSDLGMAKILKDIYSIVQKDTSEYISPEVFNTLSKDDVIYYPNSDVWSLGCVLYELIFLKVAFPNGQNDTPKIPSNVSRSGIFSTILPKMLKKDHKVRIDSKELMTKLENLLDKFFSTRDNSVRY